MALTVISTSVSTLAFPSTNDLLVTRTGEILLEAGIISRVDSDATILGLVTAAGINQSSTEEQRITIGEGGMLLGVSGNVSALVMRRGIVDNAGQIVATSASAIQTDEFSSTVTIVNSGSITARDAGLFFQATGGTVRNTGLIDGGSSGITIENGVLDLLNGVGGTVSGRSWGVLLSSAATVVNDGLIAGRIGLQVSLGFNARIENGGQILGTENGILVSVSASEADIANAGRISGGVSLSGNGHSLTSSGTITNTGPGRAAVAINGNDTTVLNAGTIEAAGTAISVADAATSAVLRNTGTVLGGVDLGAGTGAIGNALLANTLVNTGIVAAADAGVTASVAAQIENDGRIGGRNGIVTEAIGVGIVNRGDVSGTLSGLLVQGSFGTVVNSGTISGGIGILLDNTSFTTIENTGTIEGTGVAIQGQTSDATASVNNAGRIVGDVSVGSAFLTNTGEILGSVSFAGAVQMLNTGTIQATGSLVSVLASGAADQVVNAGTIANGVELRPGDDFYDGTLGRVLRGEVFGDLGNDTLIGGAFRDVLSGSAGNDSLVGGGGDDVLIGGANLDTLDGGEGNDLLRPGSFADEIDGGAGRDRLDYFGSVAVNVNLETGVALGGDATGDIFTGIEDLGGTLFNDILTGDAGVNALFGNSGNDLLTGGAGNDMLSGDAGLDTLEGGLGVDVLRGGLNADVFRFASAAETGAPGLGRDRILDFSKAQFDRIDVSGIDANPLLPLDQAFIFVGSAPFTGVGQLRAQVIGGDTYVFGNTDAVLSTAEFSIRLNGTVALAGTDFIL